MTRRSHQRTWGGRRLQGEIGDITTDLANTRATIPSQEVAVGMVVLMADSATPGSKWRVCDGTVTLSRADYPDAFEALGTTHGAGDGSTTFGLPDYSADALTDSSYWIYVGKA